MKTVAIIGAGAAGMFCAANLRDAEGVEAVILERTNSPLKKVILSGGGRCNFTNTEIDGGNPKAFYPRGAGFLRKPLMGYGCAKTREFFKTLGVESKVEDCGRVFPVSDDSRTIAGALERAAKKARLICGAGVESVEKTSDGRWNITYIDEFGRSSRGNVPRRGTDIADFSGCGCDTAPMEAVCAKPNKARGEQPSEGEHKQSGEGARNIVAADFVLFAIGGTWSKKLKESIEKLGGEFSPPVPSLFALKTDRASDAKWRDMSGASVADAEIRAQTPSGEFSARGAMLLTMFGLGGPAVLKLSAFGARAFAECAYKFPITVNWIAPVGDEDFKSAILSARKNNPKKFVGNTPLFDIPRGLWEYLCVKAGVYGRVWSNFSKGDEAALKNALKNDKMEAVGKSSHKGEFTTCGGLKCECVDSKTFSLKGEPTLFFAGECMDIDGITGGFNLQAAWTTAKICADSIKKIAQKTSKITTH